MQKAALTLLLNKLLKAKSWTKTRATTIYLKVIYLNKS